MLDDNVSELVDKTLLYVTDSIWIGKANDLIRRMKINGNTDSVSLMKAEELNNWQSNDNNILAIYEQYKNNPKIKWKESIKKVVNIEIPTKIGLDI